MSIIKKGWARAMKLIQATGLDPKVQTPKQAVAEFHLNYQTLPVGVLTAADGRWTFRYTDEFKLSHTVQPLLMFSDPDKVYESNQLWPFFRMRVPGLKQPSVRAIIEREKIDERDQIALLRRFGRKTISNPFELIPEPVAPGV